MKPDPEYAYDPHRNDYGEPEYPSQWELEQAYIVNATHCGSIACYPTVSLGEMMDTAATWKEPEDEL